MTMPPTDYRSMQAHVAPYDRQLAAAYAQGISDGRRHHQRPIVLGALAAVMFLDRRHIHPLVILLWAVVVVLVLWPLVGIGIGVEMVYRQHRRWRSWWRTAALGATWTLALASVWIAEETRNPSALIVIPGAVIGWTIEHAYRTKQEHRALFPVGPR